MSEKSPKEVVKINFPADMEFVPAIRKFVSELATLNDFTPRYAYRVEIIIDEICTNSVKFGSPNLDSKIYLTCNIFDDKFEVSIKDEGGDNKNINSLKKAINDSANNNELKRDPDSDMRGRGLEIVRMLSNSIDMNVNSSDGLTEIHVVKYRENVEDKT